MSYKMHKYCRYSSIVAMFMLIYQAGQGQYNISNIDAWMDANLESLGGRAVLLIYKDGKIVYNKSGNELSRKQKKLGKFIARKAGKPADTFLAGYDARSKIAIASCSKWLSAALVMTFVDEGKLQLDDTIGKFLPVMTEKGKGNISILDCLAHLTGIRPGDLKESREWLTKSSSMNDAMRLIASYPLEAEPGTSFHYSSVGLQVAAAVIEKISGQDFEQLFQQRIAKPCRMTNTDFGHRMVPLAAGGASSTASDYMNFLQMILHDGIFDAKQVLSKHAVELMQKNYSRGKQIIYSPREAGQWGYGLGEWIIIDDPAETNTVTVSSPGLFGSFPWVDNRRKYAAVLFTFNLNNKSRHEKYVGLKKVVDSALADHW